MKTAKGRSVEAAIPYTLFDIKYEDIKGKKIGVFFISGDTDDPDEGRLGAKVLGFDGEDNYRESPDYFIDHMVK